MKKCLCVLMAVCLMPLCLIITSCGQKEITWKPAADFSVGFNVPDEYELKSSDDGQLYTMGENEIYVQGHDGDGIFYDYEFNDEITSLKTRLGGEYEVVQIPGGYEAAHTVSNEDDLITHKYAVRERKVDYSSYYSETCYSYYWFRIVIDPETTLLPEDEMLEQFWDRVPFNLYDSSEIAPIKGGVVAGSDQDLSKINEVAEQFKDALGIHEVEYNYGYSTPKERTKVIVDYTKQELIDLLSPMTEGDWSNGTDGIYSALIEYVEALKQYYRSVAVEKYMNGETYDSISEIGERIEENDNELDDWAIDTSWSLYSEIYAENESGIQAFIDGIEG